MDFQGYKKLVNTATTHGPLRDALLWLGEQVQECQSRHGKDSKIEWAVPAVGSPYAITAEAVDDQEDAT